MNMVSEATPMQSTSSYPATAANIAGATKIEDGVVASIAGVAAREVEGVHSLGQTGLRSSLAGLTDRVTGDSPDRGVQVVVGTKEVAFDLIVTVTYGFCIPDVCENLRRHVAERTKELTRLVAKEINIVVVDLHFPAAEPATRVE